MNKLRYLESFRMPALRRLLFLLLSAGLAGCAPLSNKGRGAVHREFEPRVELYSIVAHKTGVPMRPAMSAAGKARLHGMKPTTAQPDPNGEYLDALLANLDREAPVRNGKRQILIFIHGGMNDKEGAVERSARLVPRIRDARAYYPIFINWNSHPVSTYVEHLTRIRRGGVHPEEAWLTAPIYLATDVARGIGRAPVVWMNEISYSLQQPPAWHAWGEGRRTRNRMIAAQETLKVAKAGPNQSPVVTVQTLVAADRRDTLHQLSNAAHLPFMIPKAVTSVIIDTVGTSAWDIMLRRANLLFASPTSSRDLTAKQRSDVDRLVQIVHRAGHDPLTPAQKEEIAGIARGLAGSNTGYPAKSRPGAVEQFLTALEAHLAKHPNRKYSITLVGHSMGAIVSNEILSRHPKLPVDHIVYLAAACSVKDVQNHVGPYLLQNSGANFYNVCLHPIAEATEANPSTNLSAADVAAPLGFLIPRGSLLEWLDAFFTKPMTREDRRYGKWRNSVIATDIFPPSTRSRVHMRLLPVGDPDLPEKHGDLASERLRTMFWEEAFRAP